MKSKWWSTEFSDEEVAKYVNDSITKLHEDLIEGPKVEREVTDIKPLEIMAGIETGVTEKE